MGSILCFILELSFARERVVYLTLPKKNTLGTKSSLETTEVSARESELVSIYAEMRRYLLCHRHVLFRHVDLLDPCKLQQYIHQEISRKRHFQN